MIKIPEINITSLSNTIKLRGSFAPNENPHEILYEDSNELSDDNDDDEYSPKTRNIINKLKFVLRTLFSPNSKEI